MLEILVQTATGTSSLASTTVTFTNNNTNGNSIIVAVGNSSVTAGDVSGITDTQGNNYTKAFTTDNASIGDLELWYTSNIVGGANTITVAYTTGVSCAVIAREYYGTAYPISILDQQVSTTGNSNALSSGATGNLKQTYELAVGVGLIPLADTFSVGSGWNNLTTLSAPAVVQLAMEDQFIASGGTVTATFGANIGVQWVCGVGTFFLAPTGTTTSTSFTTSTSISSTSVSSTSSSISSTSSSTSISSTSTSLSSTSSSVSSTSSSTSISTISTTSSSTSISSTSTSISSTSISSTSISSTSQSTSISSTSTSFSSTSSSISSTSSSVSSTSVSSTSSSSSTSTTLPPPILNYSYQDIDSNAPSYSLTDSFSGSFLSNLWFNTSSNGGTASVGGGLLTLAPAVTTANTSAEIVSATTYNLTNSYVVIKIPTVAVQNASTNFIISYNNLNTIYMYQVSGVLGVEQQTNGVFTSISPNPAYNSVTAAYWRIRETKGSLYFEYSANGITWTYLWSINNPFSMNKVQVLLQVSDGSSDSAPGSTTIDSINLVALPLINNFSNVQYGNVSTDDGDYFIERGSTVLIREYRVQHPNNTDNINIVWKGRSTISTLASPILIQIFNINSGAWETLASQTQVPADTDFQLQVSQTTNLSNYYDSSNTVTFRSYQLVV